jgi:hypothetical protein
MSDSQLHVDAHAQPPDQAEPRPVQNVKGLPLGMDR